MQAYELRNAGAVIHSHSLNAVMATVLDPDATEFRVTHLEMIKGIENHGFYGHLVVPIIENTARECELTDRLRQAIKDYPNTHAVLVRRHGVYIWGKDWIQAKTQAECYDYLFAAALELKKLGVDASRPPTDPLPAHANGHSEEPSAKRPRAAIKLSGKIPTAVVLDIEGTVAPISFVADVMFPYAKKQVRTFLEESYTTSETLEDIALIRKQASEDGVSIPEPQGVENVAEVVSAVTSWVEDAIAKDRKVTALKVGSRRPLTSAAIEVKASHPHGIAANPRAHLAPWF